ncbi:glucuronate isomerase [Zavarzinella formosa]|uniref:glucuronate isomerase n=1 Tax=Zavarzinella formosa TaxID=360055 RepID=UPI0002F24249|nr:glucuronate isomerase [Zavarzinella formosa]
MADQLSQNLFAALCEIPLIDPHSHIEPLSPVSKTLDDILGYHYYTELAHSAGMSQAPLKPDVSPRDRVRAIIAHMERFDNTAQYAWFMEIVRVFLGKNIRRLDEVDADALFDLGEKTFAQPDWEKQVFAKTKLEAIFLTNEFDDPLEGFDTTKYVPCLRTDTLVFKLHESATKERLAKVTGIQAGDAKTVRAAVRKLFERFTAKNAKACAISLPPNFSPVAVSDAELDAALMAKAPTDAEQVATSQAVFWMLAEHCREFKLPFDLMIGVNRRVYETGVFQGQDLFDQRTSLLQYRALFNAFLDVKFPVSVLCGISNQELVSHSWIFPNVITSGHWWYSNIPAQIRTDLTGRLQAVPKTKQIGYYSDAYKLEFVLPKFNMYRRVLANVLADEFVRPGQLTETEAVALGKRLLRDNTREVFNV